MGRGICSRRTFNTQTDGVICPTCGYHAQGAGGLALHKRVSHKDEPAVEYEESYVSCAVCGECFDRLRDLRCHIVATKHF